MPTATILPRSNSCNSLPGHVDALAVRLVELGARRLSLVGGLALPMTPWVSDRTRRHLVPPVGDALDGALQLARVAAESIAA